MEKGGTSIAADFEEAQVYAEKELSELIDRLDPDNLIICLSDDFASFRKDMVDPTYKELRANAERPTYLYEMKAWLRSNYITEERPTLEADDVMGILATAPNPTGEERIIVSADKDLMTVPGLLYRPQAQFDDKGRRHKKPVILEITPLEAIRFHFWQTIVGDSTDGYPGARGVGKKSPYAEDVLAAEDELEAWDEVLMAFASKGLDETHAVTQARLARILQHSDYDGKYPILWLPPYAGEEEGE